MKNISPILISYTTSQFVFKSNWMCWLICPSWPKTHISKSFLPGTNHGLQTATCWLSPHLRWPARYQPKLGSFSTVTLMNRLCKKVNGASLLEIFRGCCNAILFTRVLAGYRHLLEEGSVGNFNFSLFVWSCSALIIVLIIIYKPLGTTRKVGV